MNKKRQILVAGMGTSSAVLTNAVWALAHQHVQVVVKKVCREWYNIRVDGSMKESNQ